MKIFTALNSARFFTVITLGLGLILSGCGGGGGSGGGSGDAARPGTGFRVIQSNVDVSPVDVLVDGNTIPAAKAEYSKASGWIAGGGVKNIILARANTNESVTTTSLSLADGDVKTVLLYGDKKSFGVRVATLDDTLPTISSESAAVRIIHGAVGAAQLSATANGVLISAGTNFGAASKYIEVPVAASAPIRVRRVTDNGILFDSTIALEAGHAYSIVLSGDTNFLATGRVLAD